MIVSELFEGVLLERSPDVVSELRKYATNPNAYVTFVDVPKVGINPKTTFNTPLGIYAYPIQSYWNVIEHNSLPFAGDRPYVYVLEPTGHVLDLATYSKADYDRDQAKLKELYLPTIITKRFSSINKIFANKHRDPDAYGELSPEDAHWQHLVDHTLKVSRVESTVTNARGLAIWELTRMVALQIGANVPATWNKILRSLGYSGVADKTGQGIIHPNEPTQAVFFSKQAVNVVEMLRNVRRKSVETFHDYPVKVHGIDELTQILFYDDPSDNPGGKHSEQYVLLAREWPQLLSTGKSEHFEAINVHDFMESFFSDDQLHGAPDGLAGFVKYIGGEPGAVQHLLALGKQNEEAWTTAILPSLPNLIPHAKLSRADIQQLMSPHVLKQFKEVVPDANMGELIVQWALRPIYYGNGTRERDITIHDLLSKIGPAAREVLRQVPRERMQEMIDDAHEKNIPF